jgi:1-acyl-sn-glycerol-3-phosphate acyltransferase
MRAAMKFEAIVTHRAMTAWIATKTAVSTIHYSFKALWANRGGKLTPDRADVIVRGWAQRLIDHAELSVEVVGRENIPADETFVVMSNHQSLYDIPVLQTSLPLTLRMIAKSELFKVPLWSHAMLASGYVPIHRGDHTKTLSDLRAAQKAIERGISIWIAPEGTRSPDGKLGEFKHGGFHLATAVKARILPVTILGTRDCLEAKSLIAKRGVTATVIIGNPIDPKVFGRKDREGLIRAVRDAIEAPFSVK